MCAVKLNVDFCVCAVQLHYGIMALYKFRIIIIIIIIIKCSTIQVFGRSCVFKLNSCKTASVTQLTMLFVRLGTVVADACLTLPDGDYPLDWRFRDLLSAGVSARCNFVKCAHRAAFVNPCSAGTRNPDRGDENVLNPADTYTTGVHHCSVRDNEQYCEHLYFHQNDHQLKSVKHYYSLWTDTDWLQWGRNPTGTSPHFYKWLGMVSKWGQIINWPKCSANHESAYQND